MGLHLGGADPGRSNVLLVPASTAVDGGGHIPAALHPVTRLVVRRAREDVLAVDIHAVGLSVAVEALAPHAYRAVSRAAIPHHRTCRCCTRKKSDDGQQQ